MATTCVLLFSPSSNSNLSSIRRHVAQAFPNCESSTSLTPWSLSHSAFRAVIPPSIVNGIVVSTNNMITSSEPAHLHILNLSHVPDKTFMHTSTPQTTQTSTEDNVLKATKSSEATVVIPTGPDTTGFMDLLVRKLGPLWSQVKQLDLRVNDGLAWEIGPFEVLAAEIRSASSAGAAAAATTYVVRGTVLVVSLVESTDGQDLADLLEITNNKRALLREFCSRLGYQNNDDDTGKNAGIEEFWGRRKGNSMDAEIALWCSVLRSNTLKAHMRTLVTSSTKR